MMELVKTHLFNLILHVRRVIQVQIDTSRYGVKCPDLIGNAGGQYMFFLYLFYRLCLSKVRPSVSNKSYLILSYPRQNHTFQVTDVAVTKTSVIKVNMIVPEETKKSHSPGMSLIATLAPL